MSSEIKANSIQDKTGTRVLASDSGSAWSWGSGVPADTIIQVKQTIKTDTTNHYNSNSSISWNDISGMSVNITPATGNKILVSVSLMVGSSPQYLNNVKIVKGSGGSFSDFAVGDSAGVRPRSTFGYRGEIDVTMFNLSGLFLDESPGGDGSTQLTYKLQWTGEQSGTMYLNRMNSSTDGYYHGRYASTITVMEVKG